MADRVAEAEDLIALARRNGRVLMVDHTFVYTGAVRRMKAIVDSGELGELLLPRRVRINLGLFQHDVNVLWDLAPHDLSILAYLIARAPRGRLGRRRRAHRQRAGRRRLHARSHYAGGFIAPPARQLALAGEDPPDAHRRQPADDRLRRHGAEREGARVRQAASTSPRPEPVHRELGRLPLGRHVGPEAGRCARRSRSSASTSSTACATAYEPLTDGAAGPAGGATARGGAADRCAEGGRQVPI